MCICSFIYTLRIIKKETAFLLDITHEKNDLSIIFLWVMERVSSNEANATNPTNFNQLLKILW